MSELGDARLLDSGLQAEIFEWGEGRVLRLVMDGGGEISGAAGGDEPMLAREAEVMRAARAAGVPVPGVPGVQQVPKWVPGVQQWSPKVTQSAPRSQKDSNM